MKKKILILLSCLAVMGSVFPVYAMEENNAVSTEQAQDDAQNNSDSTARETQEITEEFEMTQDEQMEDTESGDEPDSVRSAQNVLSPVTGLTAQAAGKSKVKISWKVVDQAEGYIIHRKIGEEKAKYIMMTSGTSRVDTSASGTEYNFYFVYPYYTQNGKRVICTQNASYVYAEAGLPEAGNPKASRAGKNKVKLTWDKVNDAEGYIIYKRNSGTFKYAGMTGQLSYTDTKASGAEYNFYKIYPYYKENGRNVIGRVNKYIYAKAGLSPVTNLKAQNVNKSIKITWSKVKEADGYIIYRREGDGSFKYLYMKDADANSFTDTKCTKDEYNFYRVYPYYVDGNGKRILGTSDKYVYGYIKESYTGPNDVTRYTYEIIPILAPFGDFFYVKTNNPDPSYVRFIDRDCKYTDGESSDPRYVAYAAILPTATRFADVKYENKKTGRVKGGYIFQRASGWYREYETGGNGGYHIQAFGTSTDGGTLILQQASEPNAEDVSNGGFLFESSVQYKDTKVKVNCPKILSVEDYLISNYTSSSNDLFTNLSNVQYILNTLSIYPNTLYDTSKRSAEHPYPMLAASVYKETGLNTHYNMFQESDEQYLVEYLDPLTLSSESFPALIGRIAKELEPNCTVETTGHHAYRTISWNGKSKMYGGAGAGGPTSIYKQCIKQSYLFDGSANDLAETGSLEKLQDLYFECVNKSDEITDSYKDQLTGDQYKEKIQTGKWIRVAKEGTSYSERAYAYVSACAGVGGEVYSLENTWVDGRYLNDYNIVELNATYAQHPNANILVRNKTFKNEAGKTVTQDVYYQYSSSDDCWYGTISYYGGNRTDEDAKKNLPADLKLTRAQVDKMQVDKNTSKLPTSGLIYDGSAEPGTAFKN